MALWKKSRATQAETSTTSAAPSAPTSEATEVPASLKKAEMPSVPTVASGVVLTKSTGRVSLGKADVYTVIARWGFRDYDLSAIVVFDDGHSEWIATFGTMDDPQEFSLSSSDNSVVHISGDKATSNSGGTEQPYEIIKIFVKPGVKIKRIVLVVYSAKNSGAGSFNEYGVSTYVLPGEFNEVPDNEEIVRVGGKVVLAENASTNPGVYTFVPAVLHINDGAAEIEPVELYSTGGEHRPLFDVKTDKVLMDKGPENADKERPTD